MGEAAQGFYWLKVIEFEDHRVSVCIQDENGPCPLIALANILLLNRKITLHEDKAQVSTRMQ